MHKIETRAIQVNQISFKKKFSEKLLSENLVVRVQSSEVSYKEKVLVVE